MLMLLFLSIHLEGILFVNVIVPLVTFKSQGNAPYLLFRHPVHCREINCLHILLYMSLLCHTVFRPLNCPPPNWPFRNPPTAAPSSPFLFIFHSHVNYWFIHLLQPLERFLSPTSLLPLFSYFFVSYPSLRSLSAIWNNFSRFSFMVISFALGTTFHHRNWLV